MPDWILYYADLTRYSSDDGPWGDAPGTGAVLLRVASSLYGRRAFDGVNHRAFFFWPPGGDSEPIGIAHLVPTLYRMGLGATLPRPFPEIAPAPWLTANAVRRFFKLVPAGMTEEQFTEVLKYADSFHELAPGPPPSRRSTDA